MTNQKQTKKHECDDLAAKYATEDNFLVALFTAAVVALHTVYPRLMLLIYGTETWSYLDHAAKIITNLVAFHERPLMRNMIFNTIRCMSDETTDHIVYNEHLATFNRFSRLIGIWFMTWYFQKIVTRRFFLQRPQLY